MNAMRARRSASGRSCTRDTLFIVAIGFVLAVVMAACTTPPPAPQTTAQRLAVAESAYTAVVTGLIAARDSGLIQPGTAEHAAIHAAVNAGSHALDVAQVSLALGDEASAVSMLSVAQAAIAELERALRAAQARASPEADGAALTLPSLRDGPLPLPQTVEGSDAGEWV